MPDARGLPTVEERETSLQEELPGEVPCLRRVPASPRPALFVRALVDPSLLYGLAILKLGSLFGYADEIRCVWVYAGEDRSDARFLLDIQFRTLVWIAFHLLFSLPPDDHVPGRYLPILQSRHPPLVRSQKGRYIRESREGTATVF